VSALKTIFHVDFFFLGSFPFKSSPVLTPRLTCSYALRICLFIPPVKRSLLLLLFGLLSCGFCSLHLFSTLSDRKAFFPRPTSRFFILSIFSHEYHLFFEPRYIYLFFFVFLQDEVISTSGNFPGMSPFLTVLEVPFITVSILPCYPGKSFAEPFELPFSAQVWVLHKS